MELIRVKYTDQYCTIYCIQRTVLTPSMAMVMEITTLTQMALFLSMETTMETAKGFVKILN